MITVKEIADRLGFDEEDVIVMISLMFKGLDDHLKKLNEAIQQKDFDRIFSEAHSIRGAAANIGFETIANFCNIIENSARDKSWIDYETYYDALVDAIEDVKGII